MYPSNFAYAAPTSLADVLAQMQAAGDDGKLLAGGQSLIPMLKLRLAEPKTVIDLGKVQSLRGIRVDGNSIVIGAMTPYVDVLDSADVQRRCPLLVQTISQVGDPQVRSRGTVGGSIAHADPAGDLPAAAVALGAVVTATGPSGNHTYDAANFFQDVLTTALEPNEVVTSVSFSATDAPGTGTAYLKHRHPASGYAVVGIAAIVMVGADGNCQAARIGITGAGSHATRATSTEQALAGKPLDAQSVAAACANAADGVDLMGDSYASSDYRAHLIRVLSQRAVLQAAQNARR
ncbi:MAG TPA: xanthine dehydrogenase family protein subunit M [Ktedonobacterales bacterium]|nr:xanthine dehydrogenase family protein subunit M [Ktedonobacterales bacterium]